MTITIYGDSISGNCLKGKWVAEQLKIPFEWIETSVVDKETRTPKFLALNPSGQVPVVVFADGRTLAQSNAIMLHLAEGSRLIPQDAFARAKMYEWLFWEQYNHEPNIASRRFLVAYLKKPESEVPAHMLPRGDAALARMELQLKETPYLVGDALTLADIALVAYTRVAHEGGYDLGKYPAVQAWIARVERDLGARARLEGGLMYRYDEFDAGLVAERIAEFKGQVARRLAGEITEDQFKPLRLMNGVYLQLHAYMLRIAVPYGVLNSRQLECLARIARNYDKGYGHFTTRQNIQFNWPALKDVPSILEELAEVEMHAIQTSGNCIRNVTADHFAGAAPDEFDDPRVWSEIIRQWSTFHPEFSYLPRKFKIAVTGAEADRAAVQVHDIGLQIVRGESGQPRFVVYVGGGQGRTPFIAPAIKRDLEPDDLLSYLEACLRVYNRYGRRDNLFKARIKILVSTLGAEEYARQVDEEWRQIKDGALKLPHEEVARIRAYFAPPPFEKLPAESPQFERAKAEHPDFARWIRLNTLPHRQPGYAMATISLKPIGGIPGDATAEQMEAVAASAKLYSFDEARVTHEQNLVLPHVKQDDLFEMWLALKEIDLATPNAGLISDIIACPGLDYCDLANARSINIAQAISEKFADLERQENIGELKIKISGCINACGHHHVGHIGILGVDRHGEEFYQILLGGRADERARLAKIIGKGMPGEDIPAAIERVVTRYLALRADDNEIFIDAYERVGPEPFEEALYGA